MNILFLANPHSIHDEKWIKYFSENKLNNTYLLPRAGHAEKSIADPHPSGAIIVTPIVDFSLARFFKTTMTAFEIKSVIKKHKIDLIHILYAEPNALWCLFRRYFDVPMIITSRGTDVLKTIAEVFEKKRLINYIVAPVYKRAFLMADWVTGTSRNQVESVSSFSDRRNKISIIRTGVDLKRLQVGGVLPKELAGDTAYVLFPRFIRPLYNHEFCLEAIDRLPLSIKTKYKMVFLGRNSGDALYQKILEKKMKDINNVEFVFLPEQSQDNLFELYKRSSLVVMTPHSDGSPVSAMETILCGTKLILGPLDYDDDIFSEAIRLKQWDARELAETITNALRNPDDKPELTKELKQSMDRNYNMKKMMEIYKKLCNET